MIKRCLQNQKQNKSTKNNQYHRQKHKQKNGLVIKKKLFSCKYSKQVTIINDELKNLLRFTDHFHAINLGRLYNKSKYKKWCWRHDELFMIQQRFSNTS